MMRRLRHTLAPLAALLAPLAALLAACGDAEPGQTGETAASAGASAQAGGAGQGAAGKNTGGKTGSGGKGGKAGQGGAGVSQGGTGDEGGSAGASGASGEGGEGGAAGQADSPYFARILGDAASQAGLAVASVPGGAIWFAGGGVGTVTIDGLSVSSQDDETGAIFLGQVDRLGQAKRLAPLGQPGQMPIPYRLAPAADGGVYALLLERGPVDVGLGALTGDGEFGTVVVRFDAQAKPVWQLPIVTGPADQYPAYSSLGAVPGGGVVVAATPQRVVRRLDEGGATLWERTLPDTFRSSSLVVAGERVHLAGRASSGPLGSIPFEAQGEGDGVVLSLDLASGEPVGVRSVGAAGARTLLLSVAAEADGSLLVGGSAIGVFPGLPSSTQWSPWALWARLPATGAPSWVRGVLMAETNTSDDESAIAEVMVDAQGGEHVVLFERGTFDAGLGPHTSTDFQNVGDLFVLDLGPDGAATAQRLVVSGVENDVGRYEVQAQADADGLVLCGSFRVKAGPALGSDEDAGGEGQVYVTRLAP